MDFNPAFGAYLEGLRAAGRWTISDGEDELVLTCRRCREQLVFRARSVQLGAFHWDIAQHEARHAELDHPKNSKKSFYPEE